jgi:hypothetical protein
VGVVPDLAFCLCARRWGRSLCHVPLVVSATDTITCGDSLMQILTNAPRRPSGVAWNGIGRRLQVWGSLTTQLGGCVPTFLGYDTGRDCTSRTLCRPMKINPLSPSGKSCSYVRPSVACTAEFRPWTCSSSASWLWTALQTLPKFDLPTFLGALRCS